jgi:4-amino-4-deoxy-L-arabinose transferase-like glycosyltransferase
MERSNFSIKSLTYGFALVVLIVSYGRGMFIPLMHNDSGHHAIMAMRMYLTGDYVNIMDRGADYLDKPHFHFWSSAFFYNIFGVSPFSYRFTSILFSIGSLLAAYGLGRELYNKQVGKMAALILASSIALILANQDVRMDAILTGSIMMATWMLVRWINHGGLLNMTVACLALATGFSTKGALGVVMPLMALFFYLVYARRWKDLFNIKWLGAALVTLIFVTPVLLCYYWQFDLHPEKVIRGQTGISGLKFIFFGQTFERFEGTNFGSAGSNDPFVFVNTYFWAFLPWIIPGLVAYFKSVWGFVRNKFSYAPGQEFLTTGTITLFFLLFSLSSFKLPHYFVVLIPFYAIQTAAFIDTWSDNAKAKWKTVQLIIVSIMLLVLAGINFYVFPIRETWLWVALVFILIFLGYQLFVNRKANDFAFAISLTGAALTAFLLNFNFYPQLLPYQAGKELATRVVELKIDKDQIRILSGFEVSNDFDFTLATNVPGVSWQELKSSNQPLYVYTGDAGLQSLKENGVNVSIVAEASNYRITRLTPKFLNPRTRQQTLKKHFLLLVNRQS